MKPKYTRMVDGLKRKAASQTEPTPQNWFLYILECHDGTFYTGITNDVKRRVATHNKGKGARYTQTRCPVKLRYQELCVNRSAALIREYALKRLSRVQKENLIQEAVDQ